MLFLQYDFHASDQKMGSMTPPLKSGWGECVPQPMENNIGEQLENTEEQWRKPQQQKWCYVTSHAKSLTCLSTFLFYYWVVFPGLYKLIAYFGYKPFTNYVY